MTSLGSGRCDVTVDTLDLTAFREHAVCAILLPESTSASNSVRLQENESMIASITQRLPPSPNSSVPGTPELRCFLENSAVRDGRGVLILRQTPDNERFTFGASQDSDVVLKHPESEARKYCYINLLHFELYPKPNSNALRLYNNSTSTFSFQSFLSTRTDDIKPGHGATLNSGSWRLALGEGLKFQIKVIPRTDHEVYHCCIRGLSGRRSPIKSSQVSTPEAQLARPISAVSANGEHEPSPYQNPKAPPPTARTSDLAKARSVACPMPTFNQFPAAPRKPASGTASKQKPAVERSRPRPPMGKTSGRAKTGSAASGSAPPMAAPDKVSAASSKPSLKLLAFGQQSPSTTVEYLVAGTQPQQTVSKSSLAPPSTTIGTTPVSVPGCHWESSLISETKQSKVSKATHAGITMAIKVCQGDDIKQAAKIWRNEVDILRSLSHPCVVELIGYKASTLHLELEFIGPSLAQKINEERMSSFSEGAQDRIWLDVSNGLEYIHSQGIIHHDIKPGNILFDPGDRGAVICDFGISAIQGSTRGLSTAGTACYIPPEYLITNQRGTQGDVWAFGVTMLFVFRLIALPSREWTIANIGLKATTAAKMQSWLVRLRCVKAEIPEARSLLRRMLVEQPRERVTAAGLVMELLAVQSHGPGNRMVQT